MKRLGIAIAVVFGLPVLLAVLGQTAPAAMLFTLLGGWAFFLVRSVREVTVNPTGIATGIIALALFVAGLHWFLCWLRAVGGSRTGSASERPSWPLPATLAATALVVMLFAAGIAVVGITHQLAWMFTSDQRLIGFSHSTALLRSLSGNKLKQIGLGVMNYEVSHRDALPPGATLDEHGRALHGWQTMLLPYVDEAPLFNQIDFTRPWDDPANQPLFRTVVDAFNNPAVQETVDANGFGLTHYAGNARVLGGTMPLRIADITDGTANTILAGEAAGNFPAVGQTRQLARPFGRHEPLA